MPTLFSDLQMDPVTGDLDISGDGLNLITSNQISLRQRLWIKFSVWAGDWFFDESFGFPYRTFISKKVMKSVLDGRIKQTVREEPDVIDITSFNSAMEASSRSYECYMTVTTNEGEDINIAFTGSSQFAYPTPPEDGVTLCGDNQWIKWQNKLYYLINFRLPIYGDATWYNKWSVQDPITATRSGIGTQDGRGISTQDGKLIERGN
ncbi:hypothetical protein [Acinetobacter phage ABPH49]|nr:hypothetical protein [Acinetobacter phage ABPH49]